MIKESPTNLELILYHRTETRWSVLLEPLVFEALVTGVIQRACPSRECCQDLLLVDALLTRSFLPNHLKYQTSITSQDCLELFSLHLKAQTMAYNAPTVENEQDHGDVIAEVKDMGRVVARKRIFLDRQYVSIADSQADINEERTALRTQESVLKEKREALNKRQASANKLRECVYQKEEKWEDMKESFDQAKAKLSKEDQEAVDATGENSMEDDEIMIDPSDEDHESGLEDMSSSSDRSLPIVNESTSEDLSSSSEYTSDEEDSLSDEHWRGAHRNLRSGHTVFNNDLSGLSGLSGLSALPNLSDTHINFPSALGASPCVKQTGHGHEIRNFEGDIHNFTGTIRNFQGSIHNFTGTLRNNMGSIHSFNGTILDDNSSRSRYANVRKPQPKSQPKPQPTTKPPTKMRPNSTQLSSVHPTESRLATGQLTHLSDHRPLTFLRKKRHASAISNDAAEDEAARPLKKQRDLKKEESDDDGEEIDPHIRD